MSERLGKTSQALTCGGGTPPTSGFGVPIEDFWQAGEEMSLVDGGPPVRDYYPAFMRAQRSTTPTLYADGTWATQAPGFTLLFGPNDYYFSQTPELIRGMYLLGQGGHGSTTAGTRFRYATGCDGLVVHFRDPALNGCGDIGRADSSTIENIAFVGNGVAASGNHGIVSKAPIRITNCVVSGWGGYGIWLYSDTAYVPPPSTGQLSTNADNCMVDHCRVEDCGLDGVYLGGPNGDRGLNSSTCALVAVECRGVGGFAFRDYSDAGGSTFVACVERESTGSFCVPTGPNGHASNQTLLLGCHGQAPVDIHPSTIVLGGSLAFSPAGNATWLRQTALASGEICTRLDNVLQIQNLPAGLATINEAFGRLGSSVPGGALEFTSGDLAGVAYRLDYACPQLSNGFVYEIDKWWALSWAQAPGSVPLALSSDATPESAQRTSTPVPQAWLAGGAFIGSGANRVFVGAASAQPTSGTYARGDTIMNTTPTLDGASGAWVYGWVCTVASSGSSSAQWAKLLTTV